MLIKKIKRRQASLVFTSRGVNLSMAQSLPLQCFEILKYMNRNILAFEYAHNSSLWIFFR